MTTGYWAIIQEFTFRQLKTMSCSHEFHKWYENILIYNYATSYSCNSAHRDHKKFSHDFDTPFCLQTKRADFQLNFACATCDDRSLRNVMLI